MTDIEYKSDTVDVRDKITAKLKDDERSLRWLARKCGIKYITLHSCVNRKLFRVSDENLKKINSILHTDFKS